MRTLGRISFALAILVWAVTGASLALGQAVVSTRLVGAANTYTPGSVFTVAVEVSSNPTGLTPQQANFRVTYPFNSVSFLPPADGELGALTYDLVPGVAGLVEFRDALTAGNPANANATPAIAYLSFQVNNPPIVPYDIAVSADPGAPSSLAQLLPAPAVIPTVFNSSATAGLGIAPTPTPIVDVATISASLAPGATPYAAGSTFDVIVEVSNNPSGAAPVACQFRVTYPIFAVSFVGAAAGDLGTLPAVLPEEGAGITRYRDIGTFGNVGNADTTPRCYVLTFQVNGAPVVPYSITVGPDPGAAASLVTMDPISGLPTLEIPVTFDNSAVTDIGIAPTPTPVVGTATVKTTLEPGAEPWRAGATFGVIVEVSNNPTGVVPVASLLRVKYPSLSVSFEGAQELDLGSLPANFPEKSEPGLLFNKYRDVGTFGNLANADPTPQCFRLLFKVNASPVAPYNISIEKIATDPALVGVNPFTGLPTLEIPVVTDSADTQNLGVAPTPTPVAAPVTISTRLAPGANPWDGGTTFGVIVEATNNPTGVIPVAALLRVNYSLNSVSFVGAQPLELGALPANFPENTLGLTSYRDIGTFGNLANANPLPGAFLLVFQVNDAPVRPYNISMSLAGSNAGLVAVSPITGLPTVEIPVVFDNTATQDLGVLPVPTPIVEVATISSRLDPSASNTAPGSTFSVLVEVTDNPSGEPPVATLLRVYYSTASISFLGVEQLELGPLPANIPENSGILNVYREIGTFGNMANVNVTPGCFKVNFRVNAAPVTPFDITLALSPGNAGLVAKDPYSGLPTLPIPVTLDDSATRNLGIQPTPTPIVETATIAGRVDGVAACDAGTTFAVVVEVTDNPAGNVPVAALVRVRYPVSSVAFIGAQPLDLGPIPPVLPEIPDGLTSYRDIGTFGNLANADPTPGCFRLIFQIQNPPITPFDITLEQAGVDTPLVTVNPLSGLPSLEMPAVFNNAGTQEICAAPPTPTPIVGQATVRTRLAPDAKPWDRGTTFSVLVEVSANTTNVAPVAALLRVIYSRNSVSFVGVRPLDLGPMPPNFPEQNLGLEHYRDIGTFGNLANVLLTPGCFEVIFQVNAVPVIPYDIKIAQAGVDPILVGIDPLSGLPTREIPTVTDDSLTRNLGIAPTPTPIVGVATVQGAVLSGDPCDDATSFVVRVVVSDNPTLVAPVAGSIRVTYPDDAVQLLNAMMGELGPISSIGPKESAGGTLVSQDIGTFGSFGNTNLTPVVMDLVFQKVAAGATPYSILISEDPDALGALAALDPISGLPTLPIPSQFNNLAVDLCAPATPTPEPTVTPTVEPTTTPTLTLTPTVTPTIGPTTTPTLTLTPTPSITPGPTTTPTLTLTPTVTPTETVAPTVSPTFTPSPTPTGARVFMEPVGDVCEPDTDFQVAVKVDTNDTVIGGFSFLVEFDDRYVSITYPLNLFIEGYGLNDNGQDFQPQFIRASYENVPDPTRQIRIFGVSIQSDLQEGGIVYLNFHRTSAVVDPNFGYDMTIGPDPTTVIWLADTLGQPIDHWYDNTLTTGLCYVPPTPTPTVSPTETPTPMETASPTPSVSPTPTVTPPPNPIIRFDFCEDEGWNFYGGALIGFSSPTSQTLTTPPCFLGMQAQNNIDTFGFWESPVFDLTGSRLGQQGVIPFLGQTGPDSLYSAQWLVRTSVDQPSRKPTMRLRVMSENLQQANQLWIEAREDGLYSPTDEGTTYTVLFSPPAGAQGFMLEFELINWDLGIPTSPTADLALDWVELWRRDIDDLDNRTEIASYNFTEGTDGWTSMTYPTLFPAPNFAYRKDKEALAIKGTGTIEPQTGFFGDQVIGEVGFWESAPIGAQLDPSLVYILTFEVETDLTPAERALSPGFRVRMNDERWRASSYMTVESIGTADNTPVDGQPQQYVVYFIPPIETSTALLPAEQILFAFDYFDNNPADKSDTEIRLNSLVVETVPNPYN